LKQSVNTCAGDAGMRDGASLAPVRAAAGGIRRRLPSRDLREIRKRVPRRRRDGATFEESSMRRGRTLLKTLAILAPLALILSSCATEPSYAYNWCTSYYGPGCAYGYPYAYPYYAYPYPYGGFFFFDDHDRRFHDHRFGYNHFNHFPGHYPGHFPGHGPYPGHFGPGFNHGGFGHPGGFGHGGPGFMRGGGGHR
jgi:hypothetical protein